MGVITSLLWCPVVQPLQAPGNMLLTVTVHAALLPRLAAGKLCAAPSL